MNSIWKFLFKFGFGPLCGHLEFVRDFGFGYDLGHHSRTSYRLLAQVGNPGNIGNQNGNVVNENVQENVRNVLVNGNRVGCSYKEFLACNPKEYDGKGGDVVLTRCIKKMESVQDMSGCSIDQKVKYTAGSFVGKDLTRGGKSYYPHAKPEKVAVSMSWNDFKFMMIEEFCPSHEMQKLETELWNHVMVGAGHAVYHIARFLSLLDRRMVVEKEETWGTKQGIRIGRDDNKGTRLGIAFATTIKPVGRENQGALPQDCRVVPRNVNPVNVRNPTPARGACYECGSMTFKLHVLDE
ncbi:hypothetical protein Tco_1321119 [Tanacetum coccineum]